MKSYSGKVDRIAEIMLFKLPKHPDMDAVSLRETLNALLLLEPNPCSLYKSPCLDPNIQKTLVILVMSFPFFHETDLSTQ